MISFDKVGLNCIEYEKKLYSNFILNSYLICLEIIDTFGK